MIIRPQRRSVFSRLKTKSRYCGSMITWSEDGTLLVRTLGQRARQMTPSPMVLRSRSAYFKRSFSARCLVLKADLEKLDEALNNLSKAKGVETFHLSQSHVGGLRRTFP